MKYMGSKARIAKYILPIILADRKENQWYVEPFVGGANMIDKVDGKRIGADSNEYLIEALKLIRDCPYCLPKSNKVFKENDYQEIKKCIECDVAFKGYCGFALSYGGKWWGGWRRDKQRKRDYVSEAFRNAIKQSPKLKGVILNHCHYQDLEIPPNSIIYCDPPYAQTTKYKDNFDHEEFWQWCRDKTNEGHKVFISEYNAPDDFECVWQKEIVSSLTKNTGSKTGIEKLFVKNLQFD